MFCRLPSWTKKIFPSKEMDLAAGLSFQTPTFNRKLARLKSGSLLKEVLDRFNDKINHKLKPSRSLWMYSAHDTTVANLLNTLKVFNAHSPPYAATILLEMRKHKKQALISVYYKTSNEIPRPIEIPGCGIQCPLAKMYDLYNDVIPEDWETECNTHNYFASSLTSEDELKPTEKVGLTLKVVIVILLLIVVAILIQYGNTRHRRRGYKEVSVLTKR